MKRSIKVIIEYDRTEYEFVAAHPLNNSCYTALRKFLNSIPGFVCWSFEQTTSDWTEFK